MTGAIEVRRLAIPDLAELVPKRFGDGRGYFVEIHNARKLADAGLPLAFVQCNQSWSTERLTLRGLHFQAPPHAQAKLVWVVRGSAYDVAVDLRRGSPSYGKWASVLLSAERGNQILVPAGFAHGFLTLEPETCVQYMVTHHYSPDHDRGVRWDDPALAIDWPLSGGKPTLSARDGVFPYLAEVQSPFSYTSGGQR